jgi:maleylpyruvate isomerase
MILYDYPRSSAAYRVRIALNVKAIAYETRTIALLDNEQQSATYKTLNPQGLVPLLVTDEHHTINQSLSICEYLDEAFPNPPLLPEDISGRARVRSLSQMIVCDIHPLNNLRVLNFLKYEKRDNDKQQQSQQQWYSRWIHEGFSAFETHLQSPLSGDFCHGDNITLADICLVPQVYNARRFSVDLSPFPEIVRIANQCAKIEPFARANPDT